MNRQVLCVCFLFYFCCDRMSPASTSKSPTDSSNYVDHGFIVVCGGTLMLVAIDLGTNVQAISIKSPPGSSS